MPREQFKELEREKGETAKRFAARQLSSLFEHVYAHTGREMPAEAYDACTDLTDTLLEAVREEYAVCFRERY